MKTPELIAELVSDYYDGLFEDIGASRYSAAIMAVELLRESYELADHVEAIKKYLKENELPDMTRRAFVADLYDVLREVGERV